MFGINDLEALRRRIAEAGMICVGVGVLWTGGCAGAARDGLAAAGTKPGAGETQIASAEKAGHASLSDRQPAGTKRRTDRPNADRQVAARNRRSRGRQPAADPFLEQRGTVARRTARPTRPPTSPAPAARPPVKDEAANAAPAQIAARPPVAAPKATAAANPRSTPAAATVAKTAPKPRSTERTITQASAKTSQEVRRSRPPASVPAESAAPVITPAAPTAAASDASSALGYERQRADRLMERAHLMLSQNFEEEALRLATVAEQLEKSKQAIYRPGEERPSELVARLQHVSADTDGESVVTKESSAIPAVRKNRSLPAEPIPVGVRRGRVELTEISAGWHAAGGTTDADTASSDASVTGEGAVSSEQTQVALLDSNRGTDASQSSLVSSGIAPSAEAPAPPDVSSSESSDSTEPAPGPAGEDLADNSSSVEPATGVSNAPVNTTTAIGLIAGLAGLLGFAFWRRQERKHFAATSR